MKSETYTRITVCDDVVAMARVVASNLVAYSRQCVADQGFVTIAFPGGGTPIPLFNMLRSEPFASEMPWAGTHIFVSDERMVPQEDDQSNMGSVRRHLLFNMPVPSDNIHDVNTQLSSSEASREYSEELTKVIGLKKSRSDRSLDIVMLGLGEDGHIASIFPQSVEDDDKSVREVNYAYQGRPGSRVTFTSDFIRNAGKVILIVAGDNKSEILREILHGDHNELALPAQRILRKDSPVEIFCDRAAAVELLTEFE